MATKRTRTSILPSKYLKGIALGFMVAGTITAQADARSLQTTNTYSAFPSSIAMVEGNRTMAPFGHIVLCMSDPSQCQTRGVSMSHVDANDYLERVSLYSSSWSNNPTGNVASNDVQTYAPVKLTSKTWAQLNRVNRQFNAKITPRADGIDNSADVWSTSGQYGDCEDYAIQKRQALIRLGWPSHSVLITLADHPRFGPHAVLVVRTGNGDFVLDNLRTNITAWDQVNYNWKKRQSLQDPRKWVSLKSAPISAIRIASIPVPTSNPRLAISDLENRIDTALTVGSISPVLRGYEAVNHSYLELESVEFTSKWNETANAVPFELYSDTVTPFSFN